MTDEELRVRAIQELEFYKKDDTFMLADITVDLAIEALEQMPVTTTAGEGGVIYYPQVEGVTPTIIDAGKQERDVIDRAEAIKIASGYCHPANVAKELAKLPPVNPTKTGHWIFDEILDKHYYCSECKSMGVDYWDFCPYCGAKMVEPQESEDKDADKKCTYKETGCGSCKRQLNCPIEADKAESEADT